VIFLICFALLKNQPLNFRVYFPKLYVRGEAEKVKEYVDIGKGRLSGYVNLSWRSYLRSFNSFWYALRETEAELINDVGLDATVFVRIFLLGLKIFVPMLVWGCAVLIPVNKTDSYLANFQATHKNITNTTETYANGPESLSIANVEDLSKRLWAHLLAAYMFTGWTCLMLYIEYATVERMRFEFLASHTQRPEHFTVLVRQVPRDDTQSVGVRIQNFFQEIHREHYVTHQVVYKASRLTKLLNKKRKFESKLDRWQDQIHREPSTPRPTVKVRKQWSDVRGQDTEVMEAISQLDIQIKAERKKILSEEQYVMRAGFVSFDSRWGAAVCAQTQQSRDHTKWLTEWAPEPRDVYWNNLAIRYMLLNSRRLIVTILATVMCLFFLLAVGAVQVLANLEELIKYLPFLKPLAKWRYVESFISGFLPGAVLKLFLLIIPYLFKWLTQFEGHVSYSKIEKYTTIKYFAFLVVNVFFGNVLIGSLFDQLRQYIAAPTTIPKAFGVSIPTKATFFMTYIMIDGWTSIAAEVMRLWPLLWYHISSMLFVRTDKERVKVIPATPAAYFIVLPRLSLYILLGLVYAVISPLILPFLCVFFAFGFIIYRNQVIYVYEPKYESSAAFWPSIHRNVIVALIIKHITLIGLFSVKKAFASTPFLVPLPVLTILFHLFCSQKFSPAFQNYPLQEAKIKDKEEPIGNSNFLRDAYLHPSIVDAQQWSDSDDDPDTVKNGTAPGGNTNNTHKDKADTTPEGILHSRKPSNESSIKGAHDQSPARRSFGSRRRSQSGGESPGFHDAGSYLSTPVSLSRESSLPSLPREEIARSSPYREVRGIQHGSSPYREVRGMQDGGSPYRDVRDGSSPYRSPDGIDKARRQHFRNGEEVEDEEWSEVPQRERFGGALRPPLGHVEP
jgi:hypothetical protein